MVRLLHALAAILALQLASSCNRGNAQASEGLVVQPDVVSLGTVDETRLDEELEVTLENRTGERLALGPLRVSCGCLVAVPLPEMLQPGERLSLPVRLDLSNLYGPFRHHVKISWRYHLDDARAGESSISILGTRLGGAIAAMPNRLFLYQRGPAGTRSIMLSSRDRTALQKTELEVVGIDGATIREEAVDPGDLRLWVTPSDDWSGSTVGSIRGSAWFVDGRTASVTIPVELVGSGQTTPKVFLGSVRCGDRVAVPIESDGFPPELSVQVRSGPVKIHGVGPDPHDDEGKVWVDLEILVCEPGLRNAKIGPGLAGGREIEIAMWVASPQVVRDG